jgi:hypothetical protein
VYSGKLKLRSYNLAWEILYAAKKYFMPDALLIQIRRYLRKELFPTKYSYKTTMNEIGWATIQLADDFAEEELLGATWQV